MGVRKKIVADAVILTLMFIVPLSVLFMSVPTVSGSSGDLTEGAIPIKDPFGACHADSYDIMKYIGVKINRKDLTWSAVEPEDDVWDWSAWDYRADKLLEYNMTALPILDYGNLHVQTGVDHGNRIYTEHDIAEWLEYVNMSITRYYVNHSLHISQWEIWNEPNLGDFNASKGFWTGTDEEFFELQKRTAAMIKQNFPNVTVLSGGISGHDPEYLDKMFAYGAMENIDVLAFHPYSGSAYDELDKKIDEVKEVCRKYNFTGRLWITEVGMSTQFDPSQPNFEEEYRKSLELQASLVPKVYAIALANNIEKIIWYCLGDGNNWTWGETNFGLVFYPDNPYKPAPYANDTLKPAGYAYKALADNIKYSTYLPNGIILKSPLPMQNILRAFYFRINTNDIVLIVWNRAYTEVNIDLKINTPITSVKTYFPPSYKPEESNDYKLINGTGISTISASVGFYPKIFVLEIPDDKGVLPLEIDVKFGYMEAVVFILFPGLAALATYALYKAVKGGNRRD